MTNVMSRHSRHATGLGGRCATLSSVRRLGVVAATCALSFALLAACGGGGSPAPSDATKYCDTVRATQGSLSGDVQDPTAAKAAVAAFARLVSTAPPAIRGNVKTVANLIDKIAAADPTDKEGVASLFAAALDPSFLAASKKMQQFTQEQCGIDLSGAKPSLTAPTATGS
jgi:hypothetical protein